MSAKLRKNEVLGARLAAILWRLNQGEALAVDALAQEFGVDERTIQRDFAERLCSLPLERDGQRWRRTSEVDRG